MAKLPQKIELEKRPKEQSEQPKRIGLICNPLTTCSLRSCGPSPDPPDQRDSLLKEKKEKKSCVFQF